MTSQRKPLPVTIDEWIAQPAELRYELVDGVLIEKAAPDFDHGRAQAGLIEALAPWFNKRGGGGRPGGWWIVSEVDVRIDDGGFRPDVAGWRRERLPVPPKERPVLVRPDWICEILSDSNATTDTIKKLRRYHHGGVPHYWLVDPATKTLSVYRHAREGYQSILIAEAHETVRAEPFESIELSVAALFGDEPGSPTTST